MNTPAIVDTMVSIYSYAIYRKEVATMQIE